jgi:DNA-binding beta-propeller fold protein YncE
MSPRERRNETTMRMRNAAILLGLALAVAGCGQEFKLPPTPPPELMPDAGRYHYEKGWILPAPTDIAIQGAYLYVITQNRGPGADTAKAQVEVFQTDRPDATPPPPGFVKPFTGLEDPTRLCVAKSDSTFIFVANRHARVDTTSAIASIDTVEIGGEVVYDTTFVTNTVLSWSIKRFYFTGGAPLGSFSLPGDWVEVTGLTADPDLNVYVSDAVRDVVAKYDRRGRFLKTLSTRGTGDGYINQARGLDWNGADLLVADTGQDRVVFLNRDVVQTATRRPVPTETEIGTYIPRAPEDVAGDRDQKFVYIADTGRDRILKYRLTGEFVDSVYSAQGLNPRLAETGGAILAPRFVAVMNKLVFISDPVHDRLVAFALADSF